MRLSIKHFIKKILPLLLLVMVFSLLASCSSTTDSGSNLSTAVEDSTDLSVSLLNQIFGNVPGVLVSSSGQMLGTLFYYLNLGILLLTGTFLIYTVMLTTLRAAQEGTFAGQPGKNMIYASLKIAMGIALIIPNPSTGYNLAQEAVMKVAVMGVQAADNMWSYGLYYIKEGHAVWVDPGTNDADGNNILDPKLYSETMGRKTNEDGVEKDFSSMHFGEQVFLMEACMMENNGVYSTYSVIPQHTKADGTAVPATINFPGAHNSDGCGAINYNNMKVITDSKGLDEWGEGQAYDADAEGQSLTATTSLINSLQPLIQNMVCMKYNNDADPGEWNGKVPGMGQDCSSYSGSYDEIKDSIDIGSTMSNAYLMYAQNILPLYQAKNEGSKSDPAYDWSSPSTYASFISGNIIMPSNGDMDHVYSEATSTGWASAGRFFWDLMSRAQTLQAIQDFNKYHPDVPAPTSSTYNNLYTWIDSATGANFYTKRYQANNDSSSSNDSFLQQGYDTITKLSGTQSDTDSEGSSTGSAGAAFVGTLYASLMAPVTMGLSTVIADFVPTWIMVNYDNAFTWLSRSGMDMMSTSLSIFGALAAVIFIAYIPAFICSGENSAGFALKGLIDWFTPILLVGLGGLFSAGFTMRFYTCSLPYFIFTCGVISWLVSVIEAMIAAPLIGFGVTQPDGHDLMGRAEQAMMLLVGLFLRPMLMVISLFASMIVFDVTFKFILFTWTGFIWDAQPDAVNASAMSLLSAAGSGGNTDIQGLLMETSMVTFTSTEGLYWVCMMALFTVMIVHLISQCFNLITHIPDKILQWIGGPQGSSAVSVEKMTQTMQSGVKGAGDGISKGLQGQVPNGGRMDSIAKGMDEKKANEGNSTAGF